MLIKCNQSGSGSPASIQSVIHGFIKSACQPSQRLPAHDEPCPAQPLRYHPTTPEAPQIPTVKLFLSLGIAAVACSLLVFRTSKLTSIFIAFALLTCKPQPLSSFNFTPAAYPMNTAAQDLTST